MPQGITGAPATFQRLMEKAIEIPEVTDSSSEEEFEYSSRPYKEYVDRLLRRRETCDQGRAETFGGAGAQSIKRGTWNKTLNSAAQNINTAIYCEYSLLILVSMRKNMY